ncbi:MAG: precorrin-6Y C5,15-methyltransferase (decarboxylating) subunit CbiT [Arachnia sp.]
MDLSQAGLSAGVPDELFITDGLLTKRVLRAWALAMLAPRAGDVLWDLGAGTGSIAIEWCRLHPTNRAFAVERHPERAARIELNSTNFGMADRVEVMIGDLDEHLPQLPRPEAVFVGGGLSQQILHQAWEILPSGGRLAAHSVTADSDSVLLEAYRCWGGDLSRIAVENAEPIGRFVGFKPLRSVTTWGAVK